MVPESILAFRALLVFEIAQVLDLPMSAVPPRLPFQKPPAPPGPQATGTRQIALTSGMFPKQVFSSRGVRCCGFAGSNSFSARLLNFLEPDKSTPTRQSRNQTGSNPRSWSLSQNASKAYGYCSTGTSQNTSARNAQSPTIKFLMECPRQLVVSEDTFEEPSV